MGISLDRKLGRGRFLRVAAISMLAVLAAMGMAISAWCQGLQPIPAPAGPVAPTGTNPDRPIRLPENTNTEAEGTAGDWKDPAEFVRSHWVRLTPAGELYGRIQTIDVQTGEPIAADMLTVELYQKGERMGQAETDSDGAFSMSGLEPGIYALIARGDKGFLAYGLTLLPSLDRAGLDAVTRLAQAPVARPTLEIRSAAVPPTFEQLKTILEENYAQMRAFYVPEEAFRPFLDEAVQRRQPGWDQPQGPDALRGAAELASADIDTSPSVGATSLDVHPVLLSDDNMLFGRLSGIDAATGRPRNVKKTTVYIIRDDRLVTSTQVDERGYFKVALRRPNIYALVAAGEDGFGAVSFRAIKRPVGQQQASAASRWPELTTPMTPRMARPNILTHRTTGWLGIAPPGTTRVPHYDALTQLTGRQLPEIAGEDEVLPVPAAERAPAMPMADDAGFGGSMAAPISVALIDDPDTIAAAVQHWMAPPAPPLGGIADAGVAASPFAGPAGGGGFGGGGSGGGAIGGANLLGLLGLAGLGGLAGLSSGDDDQVVSPFVPPPMTPPSNGMGNGNMPPTGGVD